MLNWIVWNRTALTFKLCTYAKVNSLKMGQIEVYCILMLNWIVWNRTVNMYKNGFDIRLPWVRFFCGGGLSNDYIVVGNHFYLIFLKAPPP